MLCIKTRHWNITAIFSSYTEWTAYVWSTVYYIKIEYILTANLKAKQYKEYMTVYSVRGFQFRFDNQG